MRAIEQYGSHAAATRTATGGTTGLAAGDLVRAVRTEIRRTLKQARGDQHRAVQLGLARLAREGHLTATDVKRLSSIARRVFARDTAAAGGNVREKVETLYFDMAADADTSPVALAIAGGVAGALALPRSTKRAPNDPGKGEAIGAFTGGIIGAFLGGFTGPLGAGAGGFIGSTIGAAIGNCLD
jgi:hypothetical protein